MCILYHSTNLAIFKNSIDCVPSMKKNLQSGWGEPGSLHERKNLQSGWGKPGSPEDTAYGWTCPSRAGRGTTFPRTPLSTASWMQRVPGKASVACSIRNLVKFLYIWKSSSHRMQVASRPWKQMSESSSEDLNGVMLSFHKKTLKFKKQILKAGIGQGTPAIQIAGKPATIKKSQC